MPVKGLSVDLLPGTMWRIVKNMMLRENPLPRGVAMKLLRLLLSFLLPQLVSCGQGGNGGYGNKDIAAQCARDFGESLQMWIGLMDVGCDMSQFVTLSHEVSDVEWSSSTSTDCFANVTANVTEEDATGIFSGDPIEITTGVCILKWWCYWPGDPVCEQVKAISCENGVRGEVCQHCSGLGGFSCM